jgi:two-component system chemotaxis response regulator CheB
MTPPPLRTRAGACEAVLIAVSTGGPNALAEMVPRLPRDLPVPVLIVQHMPPVFTRLLAERLAAKAQMPVREAAEGDVVLPGEVLLAPGDHHLLVRRTGGAVRCALNRDPAENSVRPAADVLFRSAAEVWGGRVLVVVMTGMGQDGLVGAIQLHALGASVLAQDEASSVVWGMPGSVSKAGIAGQPVPLAQLANAIVHHVRGRGC